MVPEVHPKAEWRVTNWSNEDFLVTSNPFDICASLGSRIVALWAAAVSGQNVLISGKGAGQLAMLVPLLAGFPTWSVCSYQQVFPHFSAAACRAVSDGATPSALSAQYGVGPLAELEAAAAVSRGRVLAVESAQGATAWLGRRAWWQVAVQADGPSTAPSEGPGWGEGGGANFPSPLHEAVWNFVSSALASAAQASPPGPGALSAFGQVWQQANAKFLQGPLKKLSAVSEGGLTRDSLDQPSLAPAAQSFLWDAAGVLASAGVDGVTLRVMAAPAGTQDG
jgi:hypothetical protein